MSNKEETRIEIERIENNVIWMQYVHETLAKHKALLVGDFLDAQEVLSAIKAFKEKAK